MSVRAPQEISLRWDRPATTRLAWAFAISLGFHLLCLGGYFLGYKFGLWRYLPLLMNVSRTEEVVEQKKNPAQEPPLVFVEVDPMRASAEPEKETQYYSSRSSRAANPDADVETDVPKITGTQTQIPKTEDTPRNAPDRLQPDFRSASGESAPKQPPGDLALMRPDANPRPETPQQEEQPRPRTLKEVRQKIAGEKIKQSGGVRRERLIPSFDVKASLWGAYDAAFIEAVQQHWYDLLDERGYAADRNGKVVLQFRLNYDGRISDMTVVEDTVGITWSLLCRRAVGDQSPYDKWPTEMRRSMARDYREVTFTFYYN